MTETPEKLVSTTNFIPLAIKMLVKFMAKFSPAQQKFSDQNKNLP